MGIFGWNYPPGVTGREPEIDGYYEDLQRERAQDEIWEMTVKHYPEDEGKGKRMAAQVLDFIDLYELDGPDDDEVFNLAYRANRRRGEEPAAAEQNALETTNLVMADWDEYRRVWKRFMEEPSGPDPDRLYDEYRDRQMEAL